MDTRTIELLPEATLADDMARSLLSAVSTRGLLIAFKRHLNRNIKSSDYRLIGIFEDHEATL